MNPTKIPYLTHTWNPLAMRCTRVSPACDHCWHLVMANRLASNPLIAPVARDAHAGKMRPVLMTARLSEPLRRKKPARIGVQFMGDLFHRSISDGCRQQIFKIMAEATQHTFLVLTKRPRAMRMFFTNNTNIERKLHLRGDDWAQLPIPNVWLGVTVENQATADERIPLLLQTPAAVRFVSCEPLLSVVQLGRWLKPHKGDIQNEKERNGVSESVCNRGILDRYTGGSMETSATCNWESARFCPHRENTEAASASRAQCIERLPKNNVYHQRKALSGICPSSNMDDSQSIRHSTGLGNQPQEWCTERQRPCKFRTDDFSGEYATRGADTTIAREERTKRRKKYGIQTNSAASVGDSSVMEGGRGKPDCNKAIIQHFANNSQFNCNGKNLETPTIDLVITGGETGPGARPSHPDWFRSLRDQCQAARRVPFHFKQFGEWVAINYMDGMTPPRLGNGYSVVFKNQVEYPGLEHYTTKQLSELPEAQLMLKIGNKRAGNLLDGRRWEQMPEGTK